MAGTTRTVGAKVVLDGEQEYKRALADLNTGNRTLASEMRKLQAEYKGNTDSTEYLTKAGELLERQLLQQQDKVKKLQEAVAYAAKEYGEADATTQKYIQQLNNAQAAEFDLQHAIEDNTAALNGENDTMTGLGDTAEQLADKLGIRLPDGAKNALNGMKGFSAGTVAAMAAAAAAVAAVTKAVSDLTKMTLDVAAQIDEYLTESTITGVSTEMLQAWDYAAPLIDTDAETIKDAMTKITKAMGDAQDGNKSTQAAFADLGVSITDADGQLRSAEAVFYDVIDALGSVENGTQRDAAAMALMGRNAQELNPLISQGSKALVDLGAAAEETGYILDQDQIKKLGELDDAYQKLQLTIEANRKQMAADFAPAAVEAMKLFSDAVSTAGDMLERSGLIENLASIIESLIDILRTGGDILTGIPGFNTALDALKVTLGAVAQFVAVIADAADLIKSVLSLDFSGVKNALGFGYSSGYANNYQRTRMQQDGTWNQYAGYYGRNAGGTDNWRGGLTWVGEGGPELLRLPAGSAIYDAQESRSMGGDTFYITIPANTVEEFNDIIEICRSEQVRKRMR